MLAISNVCAIILQLVIIGSRSVCVHSEEYYWHITDFHYDPSYETSQDSCNDVIDHVERRRPMGDYECDAPWRLVESSVRAMHRIGPIPAFILWTGDTPPHPKNYSAVMSEDLVLQMLRNVTRVLNETFPRVPVYVTLGNHDYFPKNQQPGHACRLYNVTATDIWRHWLVTNDNIRTFSQGGYYTRLSDTDPKVRFIMLNTNLYYVKNSATRDEENGDPAGQLQWLNETLELARNNNEKVHLVTHIPPGYLEGSDTRWFRDGFHKRYLGILSLYSDIFIGIYAGHQHTDSFHIIKNTYGREGAVIQVVPSVTPWRARLSRGARTEARNPAVRRVFYDRRTNKLTDIEQYYFQLADTYRKRRSAGNDSEPQWTLLYSFKRAYGVDEISASSLQRLVSDFRKSDSPKFRLYYSYNPSGARHPSNNPTCDCDCKFKHICAIEMVDYKEHGECLKSAPCTGARGPEGLTSSLAVAVFLLIFIVFK